ncbi:Fanconi anemia group A protein homolog [Takifugu rubripes]|uniref:FA complementation group A n=1 Tax=Takifugu rubripes TaxID=31033 RepID=A0A674P349_TAKRU|nr:Fanconi anemia group A protein [Takifugu rubripes]
MSLDASCQSQKRTLSNLLAGRGLKKPKQQDCERLQKAAIQLLEQQQNLCGLLREVGTPDLSNIFHSQNERLKQDRSESNSSGFAGSVVVRELRHQAAKLGLPVAALGAKMVLERMMEIIEREEVTDGEDKSRCLLTSSQRVELRALIESSKELLWQGAFCPKLLWHEYRRRQRLPSLELVYHLHFHNLLNLKYILESDEDVRLWMVTQLKALCIWIPPPGEDESRHVQKKALSTVVGVLVGSGFEVAAADKRVSLLSCTLLDDLIAWLLEVVEKHETPERTDTGAELLIQIFDASLCGVSASGDALQRFFTHSLTQTLTYKPRFTVSDAVALQNDWTFARANRLATSLFRKLAVIFRVEQLLCQLQQVLETHEVNWKHVLCFLSTLLVYNPLAQPALKELLSRLLTSAFDGYDLENMITAFLLARQGALEGPSIFPSYTDWFKMSFSGSSGFHANSKKSLVFLLKFLSDLVPYEPPQYLKVHILHPPYVPMKHRSLLMEYVSLAKTRLADLKESVEEMGLYEEVSGAGGATVQCQAVQDVEKAVSLFEGTGKIPATVMEASIFRRPYFLTRFLPALLKPRMLPVKPDSQMTLIEALKKADKIPAAVYSTYVDSCQKQRQQYCSAECLNTNDGPLEVLELQLQQFREMISEGDEGEMLGQLSRISHTLSSVFPGCPDDLIMQPVIKFHLSFCPSSKIHDRVVNVVLRSFCQCVLDASRANPPSKQNLWASRFVTVLLGNTQFMSCLMHRIWDLLRNQGSLLSGSQLLGLAAFVVHLHASASPRLLVQPVPPISAGLVNFGDAFVLALECNTQTNMVFCVRFCLLAVCYGLCRGDSVPRQQQQDYVLSSFYKKLLYLIPRLLPEARRSPITGAGLLSEDQEETVHENLWSGTPDLISTWRKTAWNLWRHPAFCRLRHLSQYQLKMSEWLANELRIQRSEDVLTDPERHEYQQWACLELYLFCPVEQGGCGGDMKVLCTHLLSGIMDQALSYHSQEKLDRSISESGTCVPDILSRVQELVYEMEMTERSPSGAKRTNVHDFLFELVSERCSSQSKLSLHCTLTSWNRVLLALPAPLFIGVKTEGGRTMLELNKMIKHVNQHQRNVCSPSGLLSCHLTAHFLKGVLYASVRCGCPAQEFNNAWSQIQQLCPLLLVSAAHWWGRLSPMLSSLWQRLCEETLPQQLQLLTVCRTWASSFTEASLSSPVPSATDVLLAASLHRAWRRHGGKTFSTGLNKLRMDLGAQHRQVLVFLFYLCLNDYLSALLYAQEKCQQGARTFCSDLLSVLVDSADWLFIFKPSEKSVCQSVAPVATDDFTRLLPWTFYSLLLQLSPELLRRAVSCPGFLPTAVLSYIRLLQIYLDGLELGAAGQLSNNQVESVHILSGAKRFLLRVISQTPPTSLSSRQLTQLMSECKEADPDVAAALSVHLDPHSLSPQVDFL